MPKLRLGMIGGGPGAFIGPLHRMAAELDGRIAMVAGAFSSDPERSRIGGERYGIDPDRAYPDFATMMAAESGREDGVQAVAIVTPNHLHLPAARTALSAGLGVISDKPATATLAEARVLADLVAGARRPYALTYTYSGYPMVREARNRIAEGGLGRIRRVSVEYVQGWLSTPVEREGNKQAEWRADPGRAGAGGCIGDIGVHAFHLAEFVTGLQTQTLLADLGSVVPGRVLDDDVATLLRFEGDVRGVLTASQVATGEQNALTLKIYGDKAGLVWRQEDPNRLTLMHSDSRHEVLFSGSEGLCEASRRGGRTPAGHPQGYIEAFANLYSDFADLMAGRARPPPSRD